MKGESENATDNVGLDALANVIRLDYYPPQMITIRIHIGG